MVWAKKPPAAAFTLVMTIKGPHIGAGLAVAALLALALLYALLRGLDQTGTPTDSQVLNADSTEPLIAPALDTISHAPETLASSTPKHEVSSWCDAVPTHFRCVRFIEWVLRMGQADRELALAQLGLLMEMDLALRNGELSDNDREHLDKLPLQRFLSYPPELMPDTERQALPGELKKTLQLAKQEADSDILPLQLQWLSALTTATNSHDYLGSLVAITGREQQRRD